MRTLKRAKNFPYLALFLLIFKSIEIALQLFRVTKTEPVSGRRRLFSKNDIFLRETSPRFARRSARVTSSLPTRVAALGAREQRVEAAEHAAEAGPAAVGAKDEGNLSVRHTAAARLLRPSFCSSEFRKKN